MQSYELLQEVFKSIEPKRVAADLGISPSRVYQWREQQTPGSGYFAFNPLERMDQLYQSTQDARLIHWICQRAGGFFIQNPKTHHPHPDYLIPAMNQVVQEFADLFAVIAGAAADSHIDAVEAGTMRKRWEELKTVTETFVKCSEEGNFRSLREPPAVTNR